MCNIALSGHLLLLISVYCINVITGISYFQQYSETNWEDLILYEGTDFLMTVTSSLFVDRSMLVQAFINNTRQGGSVLILAPPKYGKSTNIYMIKRFFSINVNEKGDIKYKNETSNYLLFTKNNLKIYRNRQLFDSHFGNSPVIHIDYEPLKNVKFQNDIREMLSEILLKTVKQHEYLGKEMFSFNENILKSKPFINNNENNNKNESYIKRALILLARQLHKKFYKKAIVLIDNYDSFMGSRLYSTLFNIVRDVNLGLLTCEYVARSLITGVSITSMDVLPSNVVHYGEDSGMWKYFGLTDRELNVILQPFIPDRGHREQVMDQIKEKYCGTELSNVCSVWAVTRYLQNLGTCENLEYKEYSLG